MARSTRRTIVVAAVATDARVSLPQISSTSRQQDK